MKKYQVPEILFQNLSTKDVLTVSSLFALFDAIGNDKENELPWGQVDSNVSMQ